MAPKSWSRAHVARAALFGLALLLYFLCRSPFVGQWDAFDYLKQIIGHEVSPLGLGRTAFIGYNIALWEAARRLFGLESLQVEAVAMAGVITLGAAGVLAFKVFASQLLPPRAALMATLGFLFAPMYAIYSGYIMTEVPMLFAAVSAAALLWRGGTRRRAWLYDLEAGLLFGIAVGMREQAVTLAAAYIWILWARPGGAGRRVRSGATFAGAACIIVLAPLLALYLRDPAAFMPRMKTWLAAIPTDRAAWPRNIQASLLYAAALAPGAWLALLAAHAKRRRGGSRALPQEDCSIRVPFWGIVGGFVLPLVFLWRDADVQIHPRYLLVVLPAAILLCAFQFHRHFPGRRGLMAWTSIQVCVFLAAQWSVQPFRQMQIEKREYAQLVLSRVADNALLIPGGYSPVFDYYRVVGHRSGWQVLWSGWAWNANTAAREIEASWKAGRPVYVCDGPFAWLYFEHERLELFRMFRHCRFERVAPGLSMLRPRKKATDFTD
jgi:hypothetical protein